MIEWRLSPLLYSHYIRDEERGVAIVLHVMNVFHEATDLDV